MVTTPKVTGNKLKFVQLSQLEANKKAPSERKTSGLMAKLEALQKEQERLQKERQERMNKK